MPVRFVAVTVSATLLAAVAAVPAATAADVSAKVRRACSGDAQRLCPQNKFGSAELRYCMEAKGRYLSGTCVRALEDDGVLPRGALRRTSG